MKAIYILAVLAGLGGSAVAQGLASVDGTVTVRGGILQVKGNLQLGGGSFTNNGNVFVSGNLVNNQAMAEADTGALTLNGTAAQTVSGNQPYFTRYLTIDNPGGILLDNDLKVGGRLTFSNGIVTATSGLGALVIGDTATVVGVSDDRHVDGYVVKMGTGSFTYPLGDGGIRYQPITVDLTENSAGMGVRYFMGDAGSGPFGTTGASNVALEAYNDEEYWDLAPRGTATGKVTITYDNYKNPVITTSINPNVFSVAHLTGGNWLNEGSNVSGTLLAGTVTSEVLSNWSPFTLGAVPPGLPVTLISFDAKAVENNALLEWQTTSEDNASHFEVERSLDAKSFQKIGSVDAAGKSNDLRRYTFTDRSFGNQLQTVYYRLRSVDLDGTFSLTKAVSLQPRGAGRFAGLYPNPARKAGTVTLASGTPAGEVSLWDMLGRQVPVRTAPLPDGSVQVSLSGVASGMYLLKLTNEQGVINHKLVVE